MSADVLKKTSPCFIWKYDKEGNERPLQEQLDRRKADLKIAQMHITWYNQNPLHRNNVRKKIAQNKRQEHLQKVLADIKALENQLT